MKLKEVRCGVCKGVLVDVDLECDLHATQPDPDLTFWATCINGHEVTAKPAWNADGSEALNIESRKWLVQ